MTAAPQSTVSKESLPTAETVRAREFLAHLLPHLTSVSNVGVVAQLIRDVRAEERERCARIARSRIGDAYYETFGYLCAESIAREIENA